MCHAACARLREPAPHDGSKSALFCSTPYAKHTFVHECVLRHVVHGVSGRGRWSALAHRTSCVSGDRSCCSLSCCIWQKAASCVGCAMWVRRQMLRKCCDVPMFQCFACPRRAGRGARGRGARPDVPGQRERRAQRWGAHRRRAPGKKIGANGPRGSLRDRDRVRACLRAGPSPARHARCGSAACCRRHQPPCGSRRARCGGKKASAHACAR
jgi:hypothetical protein